MGANSQNQSKLLSDIGVGDNDNVEWDIIYLDVNVVNVNVANLLCTKCCNRSLVLSDCA